MYNIYNVKGEKLVKILHEAWEKVVEERTPFQKYFMKKIEDYHNIYMNSMKTEDEEWIMLWEIQELETIKFYKYLGFEVDNFTYGKDGSMYYIAYPFGSMKNKNTIDSVSLRLRKVDENFKKEETNCFNVFSVYFDIGRTLYGIDETNFIDFYITKNIKIEKRKFGNMEVGQFKWII